MTSTQIRNTLEQILTHMEPHWHFVNCHMVNFLTEQFWKKFIPSDIQNCVNSDNIELAIKFIFSNQTASEDFNNLATFLSKNKSFQLDNLQFLLTSQEDLFKSMNIPYSKLDTPLSIVEFMSEKKRHEVEKTAELIAKLVKTRSKENHFIIDAGDGKGYLSSRLALQYGFQVLGIDSNKTNTENAVERNKKLERAWTGLNERANLISKGIVPTRRKNKPKLTKSPTDEQHNPISKTRNNYQTINTFITTELNIVNLVKKAFLIDAANEIEPKLTLTGLHTCGNLASTCLKVFTSQSNFEILCNIGCCYHLINEEFSKDEFFGNKVLTSKNVDFGFPLSQFLKKKQVKLGRNARMLAAQSIHRTINAQQLPNHLSLFYRALLEALIAENHSKLQDQIQVGKIKTASSFVEYVQRCNEKLKFNLNQLNDDDLQSFERKYINDARFLDLFYLIRMSFAPILETIILLDRLLYLKENDFDLSYLIQLFDPVVSPRCYCLIALK